MALPTYDKEFFHATSAIANVMPQSATSGTAKPVRCTVERLISFAPEDGISVYLSQTWRMLPSKKPKFNIKRATHFGRPFWYCMRKNGYIVFVKLKIIHPAIKQKPATEQKKRRHGSPRNKAFQQAPTFCSGWFFNYNVRNKRLVFRLCDTSSVAKIQNPTWTTQRRQSKMLFAS